MIWLAVIAAFVLFVMWYGGRDMRPLTPKEQELFGDRLEKAAEERRKEAENRAPGEYNAKRPFSL